MLLLILVGAVFVLSPAQLLNSLAPSVSIPSWVWIILIYYFIATLLPIDKIIGKIYPLFGVALIAMAVGLVGALLFGGWRIPELTTLHNFQLDPQSLPIFPTLHHDRLRSYFGIPCHAVAADGPLRGQRT